MEHVLGFLLNLLVGQNAGLKRQLAGLGVTFLPFVALFALYIYVVDPHPNILYLIVLIASVLGTIALFILLINWRFQEVSTYIRVSRQPSDAYAVIEELRSNGILSVTASPLSGADWAGVTLRNANLYKVNFKATGLEGADLRQANLTEANLRSARLEGANLSEAVLAGANLCYARLQKANLQQAQLANADLSAADLSGALLQGAHLKNAHFDQHTTLPDGRKWTPDTDWTQFGALVTLKSK